MFSPFFHTHLRKTLLIFFLMFDFCSTKCVAVCRTGWIFSCWLHDCHSTMLVGMVRESADIVSELVKIARKVSFFASDLFVQSSHIFRPYFIFEICSFPFFWHQLQLCRSILSIASQDTQTYVDRPKIVFTLTRMLRRCAWWRRLHCYCVLTYVGLIPSARSVNAASFKASYSSLGQSYRSPAKILQDMLIIF